uniref:Odz3_1 protein n=1 Tax=Fopius arisanus TaxID=64838 RepID=A0A0C9RG51_9HYME
MSTEIRKLFLVLFIGILSASSKSDDGVITVPSTDIPSDGKGIIPAGDGTSNNTSMTVPPGLSSVPGLFGLVYRVTIHPMIVFLRLFLDPIFSLLRGVVGPVLAIVNYLLGELGLPTLGELLNELLMGLQGHLGRILGEVSGFVGTLLGPQNNSQPLSRRRRSVMGFLMSPITTPLGYAWSIISMPWRIASASTNMVTTPLYYGYRLLSYPLSGAMAAGTWPTRRILRLLGFGGTKETLPNGQEGPEKDPIDDLLGSLSESAQDALAEALVKGFQLMKSDILPAIDAAAVNYQDSDMVPDSLKDYMKNFHQVYSLLHTLRVL